MQTLSYHDFKGASLRFCFLSSLSHPFWLFLRDLGPHCNYTCPFGCKFADKHCVFFFFAGFMYCISHCSIDAYLKGELQAGGVS